MIKEITLVIKSINPDLFQDPTKEDRFLCKDGVRRYFDVPKGAKQITVCTSDCYVEGATEATVAPLGGMWGNAYCINFDRCRPPVIVEGMGKWFPQGKFWFWIEYEETSS